jgi:hypothetical protein
MYTFKIQVDHHWFLQSFATFHGIFLFEMKVELMEVAMAYGVT